MRKTRFPHLILALLAAVCLSACVQGPTTTFAAAEAPVRLVELNTVIPDVLLDIRYATTNNFTGKVVYPSARCFLAEPAAMALGKVQADLRQQGYRLVVFDGYRPLHVQKIFWKILPDPRYVGDPAKGSKHNRGYAVDVTLADLQGRAVEMPTEFDDFSEKAATNYPHVTPAATRHRQALHQTMARHGFTPFVSEWWHFDYHGWENQPVRDIPFDAIR
jgi:D-alanyl-D-alanine dipeptidase